MTTATISSPVSEHVALRRLVWVGPLAVVGALAANALLRAAELAVIDVPASFTPLASPAFVPLTLIGVLGAIAVFAIIGTRASRPISTFRLVATGALLLSFLPDLGLLFGGLGQAPASVADVLALMLMHVAAFVVSVGLLTTLTRQN